MKELKSLEVLTMERFDEQRREQRLRYHWPVWFAEDFSKVLSHGQMVDVSSSGAAFTCYADRTCPYPGQHLTARFSVPHIEGDDNFNMSNFTRQGHVCRIDNVSSVLRRVAIQFADELPFKPGEQAESESQAQEKLKPVTI